MEEMRVITLPARKPLPKLSSRGKLENIIQSTNIAEITDRLTTQAFDFCERTGSPVTIQGARITFVEEQKGKLRKSTVREFTIEMPNVQIGGR